MSSRIGKNSQLTDFPVHALLFSVGQVVRSRRFNMDTATTARERLGELGSAMQEVLAFDGVAPSGASDWGRGVIDSIRAQLWAKGWISEKQVALVAKIINEAEQNKRAAVSSSVAPEGRKRISGTVLALKLVESDFGPVVKMLVDAEDLAGHFRVWVTRPSGCEGIEKGDFITMMATLKRSLSDDSFAFGSRPSNANYVSMADDSGTSPLD